MSESEILGAEDDGGQFDPGAAGDIDSQPEQDGGESEAPSRQYVEVDDPDQRFVRVKVDGEELEVPLSEALRGYSREADYTRKAQTLAQQRQEAEFGLQLQRALQANPEQTLRLLQEQYQRQATPEPEFDDPLERMIYEERQARIALEQRLAARESDEQLTRTVNTLRQEYGASDEDVRSAVQTAVQMGLGIEQLPLIYKTQAYDRIVATVQAQRQMDAAKAAQAQQRQAAAQAASRVIGTGTGTNGVTTQPPNNGKMTIREAIEAAFAEHEG